MDAIPAATSSLLFSPVGTSRGSHAGSHANAELSSPLSMSRTSALRILLVDNEPEIAAKLKRQLLSSQQERGDHQVKCSQHGLEAMVVAEGFQPQLVVIEIGWPRRSGACTAKLLRDRPWANSLVIVSHSRIESRSFEPTEHFDFHFFDGIDVELLMQLYQNLSRRRLLSIRDINAVDEGSSKFKLHPKH